MRILVEQLNCETLGIEVIAEMTMREVKWEDELSRNTTVVELIVGDKQVMNEETVGRFEGLCGVQAERGSMLRSKEEQLVTWLESIVTASTCTQSPWFRMAPRFGSPGRQDKSMREGLWSSPMVLSSVSLLFEDALSLSNDVNPEVVAVQRTYFGQKIARREANQTFDTVEADTSTFQNRNSIIVSSCPQ